MSNCPDFDYLLVLPRLHVQNANAVSSPLTHGFPSMTAFIGLMRALQRRVCQTNLDLTFKAIGVVCHDHDEQVTDAGFVKSFRLSRNPIGKDGKTAAIVEEGRIHLNVSLVFAVQSPAWHREPDSRQADVEAVAELLTTMRIAGGTLQPPDNPKRYRYRPDVIDLTGSQTDRNAVFRRLRMRLLPGFTLVARDDRLEERLTELQADNPEAGRLDAWLSLSRINWHYEPEDKQGKGQWTHDRKGKGWVVPIPIGYGALGELHSPGAVTNARDAETSFCFVESVYSVGEWISPHRLMSPQQMLWYSDSQPKDGLYRCRNDYAQSTNDNEQDPVFDFDLD